MTDEHEDAEVEMHILSVKESAPELTKEKKQALTSQEEQAFNTFVAGRLSALPYGHYPAVYHAILNELARFIVYRMADATVLGTEDGSPLPENLPPVVVGTAAAMAATLHASHQLQELVQTELKSKFGSGLKA